MGNEPGSISNSEKRLRDAVRFAPFPMMLHADDGAVLELSRGWVEVTGYDQDDIPTVDVWTQKAYGTAWREVRALIASVYTRDTPVTGGEFIVRTKAGASRTLLFAAAPLGRHGRRRLAASMALDLTDRRRAEQARAASERRYRDLVELSPDAVYVNRADRLVLVNSAMLELFGATDRGQLLGRSPYELFAPDSHPSIRERIAMLRSGAQRQSRIEQRIVRLDGAVREVDVAAVAFEDEEGPAIQVVLRDITERKEHERALRRSEEAAAARASELQTVLDTVPAAVWIARDPTGARIDANRVGAELLRRPPGSNVSVTAAADERPMNFRPMRGGVEVPPDELPIQTAARFGREVHDFEFDLVFDDGTVRHLLGNAAPILDEGGRTRGSVGAFIDISDRKEAEERLREADRRKDHFLGVLSHELRNPLAPIRNSLFLLERCEPSSPQARRARDVIQRQVTHLSRLVDDLLDVTRIARGKIEVRPTELDLRQVVERTVEDHRALMQAREVELAVTLPDEAVPARGDATRLAQLIGNLLVNAAKFTPAGGHVTVSLVREGPFATLCVRDTGAGIDPALLERIFDPFVQGEQELARTDGGLGLGLALVRSIAELHGGTTVAHSAGRGQGAEFVVRLPIADSPRPLARTAPQPSGDRPLRRVLVVDDNRDAADSLAGIVRLLGHSVDVAYDGESAIAQALAAAPNVVFCDVGLPGLDGYAVARALRSSGSTGRLVAITGYAQPDDVRAALEAGFDAHLAKPCDPAEIVRLLS